jgi:carbon-monoxide dehydrogenase large subunit
MHDGLAQGIGQAALERVVYDPDTGQLVSGGFMDYALSRADALPSFTTLIEAVPSADNPFHVKGYGPGPTTGSPAAVVNAALDALTPRSVTHNDMPLTPERLWRALAASRPRSSITRPEPGR